MHIQQVAYGVVVFGAIEAACGDMARVRFGGIKPEDGVIDPGHDFVPLLQSWFFLFLLWWHHMGDHLLAHMIPEHEVGTQRRVIFVLIKSEVAFIRAVGMAVVAKLFEQWFNLLIKSGLTTSGQSISRRGCDGV